MILSNFKCEFKKEIEPGELRKKYDKLKPNFQKFGNKIDEILESELKRQEILHVPNQFRVKDFDSFLKEMD